MSLNAPTIALIALGTNEPFGALAGTALLAAAARAIAEAGVAVQRTSCVWETPAWPPSDQPPYCNAALACDPGERRAEDVMALLLEIERRFGRERRARWAQRTLDLDLIALGDLVCDTPGLTLPHPRAHERFFVLAPLAEVAPDWRHPVTGEAVGVLLASVPAEGRRQGALRL